MEKVKEKDVYLVVTNYNFDTDMDIKAFNTEEEAKGYMKSLIHNVFDFFQAHSHIQSWRPPDR